MTLLSTLRHHTRQLLTRLRAHLAHRSKLRHRASRLAQLRALRHQSRMAFQVEEVGNTLAITHHGTPILLFLPDDTQQKVLLHLDLLRRQAIAHAQQHHCPL